MLLLLIIILLLPIFLLRRIFSCQELNVGLRLVERLSFRVQRTALLHRYEAFELQGAACGGHCRNPWGLLRLCAGLLTDDLAVLVLDEVRRLQATDSLLLLSAEHQHFAEFSLGNLAHLLLFLLGFESFLCLFLRFLCFFHCFLCCLCCLFHFSFALCCKELNIVLRLIIILLLLLIVLLWCGFLCLFHRFRCFFHCCL